MARIAGGTRVESGYYVNARSLAVVNLAADGELPGTAQESFVRVPWPLLLLAAPVVGGLFVVTYPIFGLTMALLGVARKLAGDVGEGAKDLAATLAPGHAVGEAHLTGKPGEGTKVEDEKLEKLGKEIEEKREKKE